MRISDSSIRLWPCLSVQEVLQICVSFSYGNYFWHRESQGPPARRYLLFLTRRTPQPPRSSTRSQHPPIIIRSFRWLFPNRLLLWIPFVNLKYPSCALIGNCPIPANNNVQPADSLLDLIHCTVWHLGAELAAGGNV